MKSSAETNKNHGGSREGAGRPPSIKGKKREIYCNDETWDYLVSLGKGNASKGMRILKEAHIRQTNEIEKATMAGLENEMETSKIEIDGQRYIDIKDGATIYRFTRDDDGGATLTSKIVNGARVPLDEPRDEIWRAASEAIRP